MELTVAKIGTKVSKNGNLIVTLHGLEVKEGLFGREREVRKTLMYAGRPHELEGVEVGDVLDVDRLDYNFIDHTSDIVDEDGVVTALTLTWMSLKYTGSSSSSSEGTPTVDEEPAVELTKAEKKAQKKLAKQAKDDKALIGA
jgi:hypothetical protein